MINIKTIISNGLACADSYLISNVNKTYDTHSSNCDEEMKKFEDAIKESILSLDALKSDLNDKDKEFVDVHKMILSDPVFNGEVLNLIKDESYTAAAAFIKVIDDYISKFREARSVYLMERALDMEDIKRRVMANLIPSQKIDVVGEIILVVDELFPTYLMTYPKQIVGVIALRGGYTSHSAILCKSREIPYVLVDSLDEISGRIMIDTRKNIIKLNPTDDDMAEYEKSKYDRDSFKVDDFKDHGVRIYANVSSNLDIDKAIKYGLDGIGLYRTELIFMNLDRAMSFEEQKKIYSAATEMTKDKPICFRTFDIGDDKQLSYIKTYHKGIDNYINNKDIFETQIRALISANKYNNMKIMFPMIETVDEFNYLRDWVLKIKKELNDNSILRIGMMLETKRALLDIETFKDVDFMSLGTNDLTKELYNVSREDVMNYSVYIKDLLKSLKKVCSVCYKNKIELSICGELASIRAVVKSLYKAGIRNFSVSVASAKNLNDALKEEFKEK